MRGLAIIHIAIPDLILQVELLKEPGLCGQALVIGDDPRDARKGNIAALSTGALALGLRPGMQMRRALKAAPGVTARTADYAAMEYASEKFLDVLGTANPLIETFGTDGAFLSMSARGEKVAGLDPLYPAAEKLASSLQDRVEEVTGLFTRAGIAPNKPLSRLAWLHAPEDGLRVVTENKAQAFIKTLDMEELPAMTHEAAERLGALGVNTVDELANAPLLFLEKNLGKDAARIIHEVSHGRGPVDIRPFYEPDTLSREVVFDRGPATRPVLKETLYMLTEELTSRLKAAKRTCAKVSLKITLQDFACLVRTEELEEETDSFNTTLAAALKLLEKTPGHTKAILIGLKLH